jgi:RNA polymerase sigma-70 factor (ECF subfamily)
MSEPANTFATDVYASLENLRGLARHFTRSAADAEDLIQDTCVRALTYAHTFQEGANLDAWLTTIMRRQACSSASSHHRRLISVDPVDMDRQGAVVVEIEADIDERRELAEQRAKLYAAIRKLPPLWADATRRVISGQTHQEIASVQRTTANTIDGRTSRSRIRIRELVAA